MYNARRKHLPKLPRNQNEVQEVPCGMNLRTIHGEEFVMNDVESDIILYTCLTNLKPFVWATALYVDRTFTYCTKYYYQLLSIHCFFNEHFILLTSKQGRSNIHFMFWGGHAHTTNLTLVRRLWLLTLKKAYKIHAQLHCHFLFCKTCRFHLTPAWSRKI